MSALDTIGRHHAEIAQASVADAVPPDLRLEGRRGWPPNQVDRRNRQWLVAVAAFVIVILIAIPLIIGRSQEAPVVSPPSITTVPESLGLLSDPGFRYSGRAAGIPLPLPELTAGRWGVDFVTPTGERLRLELPANLGPFERLTYWPILHVTQGEGGLNMLLAHGAAENEVAEGVSAGNDVVFDSSEPRDGDVVVSHWNEVGLETEDDIITITWREWVLGLYDGLGGRVWGQLIADALTWNETVEGFLMVESHGNAVVEPQSAVVLTFWSGPETGFSVRIAPNCATSLPDSAVFEGDPVLDDSGSWCVSDSYRVVASAEGDLPSSRLDLVRDSLSVTPLEASQPPMDGA